MRTLLKITIPAEAGNKGIQDGALQKIMGEQWNGYVRKLHIFSPTAACGQGLERVKR